MKRLKDALDQGHVILDLNATDITTAIQKTIRRMVEDGFLSRQAEDLVVAALLQREQEAPTAIGHATTIPHAYLDSLTEPFIIFVRLARPVNLNAPDGIPTRYLFVLLGPTGAAGEHLDTLAGIARLMSNDEFRYDLGRAGSHDDLLEALRRFEDHSAMPAARTAASGIGLEYSGRLFGGLIDDVRRRSACYASDFRDGLTAKSLSSTLFLFFACLAPAVTFGGIMGIETAGQIGVVEMLVASAFCGIVYALCSGQPLIILGGVGPLLVFTGILYRLSADMQLPFLSTYAWVGFWTALLLVILAATDASFLMRYFTRFTDEIFSVLMALIFIYEAIRAIVATFRTSFADSPHHDAAFLSLMLAFGTFYVGMTLSGFRRSKYLLHWMREFLADFGPMLALGAMTLLAWWLRAEVSVNTLQAPGGNAVADRSGPLSANSLFTTGTDQNHALLHAGANGLPRGPVRNHAQSQRIAPSFVSLVYCPACSSATADWPRIRRQTPHGPRRQRNAARGKNALVCMIIDSAAVQRTVTILERK